MDGPTLGFACHWNREPRSTWSGTPWSLRAALRGQTTVVDLPVGAPAMVQTALKAAYLRPGEAGWTSLWRHSLAAHYFDRVTLEREAARADVDLVVQIQDLAATPQPFSLVQDLSFSLLLDKSKEGSIPHFRNLRITRVQQLAERQLGLYERASHLFPMSHWLARDLRASGVPEDRITVVNPGINRQIDPSRPMPTRRATSTRKLLFVGRDFDTKGGDVVVGAFKLLRKEWGGQIELTIIGPTKWPLSGEVPEGITFMGPVSGDRVAAALDSHDLFVMPSRFEGFGIAFVEALSRGLPCIGRRVCAMPEIIDHESGGRLVDGDDPHVLADLILETLRDEALYERCAAAGPSRARHYSWRRAAAQIVAVGSDIAR